MTQFFLEAFQWHGVKRGRPSRFYADDIRVEGPHPFSSSEGNLGNGRTRTAMYTDSIEQLGQRGPRQVKVGPRPRSQRSPLAAAAGSCWEVSQLTARKRPILARCDGWDI